MVKLNKAMAKKVDQAEEWGDFSPVPEGAYALRLMETSMEEGDKGPYIKWVFKIEEGEYGGRQQWLNTSLAAPGAVKMAFSAFGVTSDTDTEELHGEVVGAWINQRVMQSGPRKGEMSNNVTRLFPADELEAAGDDEAGEDDGEPDF